MAHSPGSRESLDALMADIAGGWTSGTGPDLGDAARAGQNGDGSPDRWCAFHFHHTCHRDRLLVECVQPLLKALWQDSIAERFFFVRGSLGGSHVRLRLLLTEHAEPEDARRTVLGFSRAFRDQRLAVAESDDAPTPLRPITAADELTDAFCVSSPFAPPVERYGGPEYFSASADVFTVTSILALRHLESSRDKPWAQRLPNAFRILADLAIGLARSSEEWLQGLAYVERWWGLSPLTEVFEHADSVFERQRDTLSEMWRTEFSQIHALDDVGVEDVPAAFVAGRSFSERVRNIPSDQKRQLFEWQLHTTANRLGLTHTNEVYLGRLLLQSARCLAASGSPQLSPWPRIQPRESEPLIRRLLEAHLGHAAAET
ncbi:MAG: lantibiotic dehydratase C-terminal domain-containing protein [Acidobacteriota bacterium]